MSDQFKNMIGSRANAGIKKKDGYALFFFIPAPGYSFQSVLPRRLKRISIAIPFANNYWDGVDVWDVWMMN